VTLIDRNPYQLFSPLLYQVATASLPEDDIAFPVRTAYREVQFVRGDVKNVDVNKKEITLSTGKTISYDDLILAVGSEGTTFGIPGVAEHCLQMKSVNDAREIRRSLLSTYESVEDGLLPLESLNVVIVGGGPTGVELAGAVGELQREIQREFEHIAPKATVTLLEAGPRLLPSFHPYSSKYTLKTLTKMGVQVKVDAAVVEATSRSLRLKDGTVIIAGTRIWAAGVVAKSIQICNSAIRFGLLEMPRVSLMLQGDHCRWLHQSQFNKESTSHARSGDENQAKHLRFLNIATRVKWRRLVDAKPLLK
jgi:NADH dehydrogenase